MWAKRKSLGPIIVACILLSIICQPARTESQDEGELKVLSLNAWQFPLTSKRFYLNTLAEDGVLAKDIRVRRKLIAHKVSESGADIVTFQELWGENPEVFTELMNEVGYPYCVHKADVPTFYSYGIPGTAGLGAWAIYRGFKPKHKLDSCASAFRKIVHYGRRYGLNVPGGVLLAGAGSAVLETADHIQKTTGNGLLICSKYPIKEPVDTMHFSYWHFTNPEEPLAPKGAMKAKVEVPGIGNVDVVTTHMDARAYDENTGEYVPRHTRVVEHEIDELYQWLRKTRTQTSSNSNNTGVLILTGDFNLNYREVKNAQWTDRPTKGYETLTDQTRGSLKLVDSFREIHGFSEPPAFTDSRENLYEAKGKEDSSQPSEVIDYVFYGEHDFLKAADAKVIFKEPVTEEDRQKYELEGHPKQLSDHFGVMTVFKIKKSAKVNGSK